MSKKLYLECTAGISGDMFVAALLDLGVSEEILRKGLKSLGLDGYTIQISRVKKQGLDACDFNVIQNQQHDNHDHDMEFLHGEERYQHGAQEHSHHHKEAEHTHHHKEHEHRNLKDILFIIQQADLTENAKKIAIHIFEILAEAEAKAHGVTIDEVHFHEVGAIDSIVDIVAAAICMDVLNVKNVVIPVLYEGSGFIRCQHGVIPVPVPAVASIVQTHALALKITETQGEFVTPTGAAIAAAIRTTGKLPDCFTIIKTGIGAGKRNYERPSILRTMLIEAIEQETETQTDTIYKLESNIDDCTGEILGYVMECLMEAGAKDVYYTPIYMKKNRPAYQLNILCTENQIETLEEIVFSETTTIGIRRQKMKRSILKRDIRNINTSFGEATVKVCSIKKGCRYYPEYESMRQLAKQNNIPMRELYELIMGEINGEL